MIRGLKKQHPFGWIGIMIPYDGPHCPPAAVEVQGFACQSALGFSQQHQQLGLIEDYKTMISHMEKKHCLFVYICGFVHVWVPYNLDYRLEIKHGRRENASY